MAYCTKLKCASKYTLGVLSKHTNKLTTWSTEHSPWEPNISSISQQIPTFYGHRKFITTFTSARHLSLFWAASIQAKSSSFFLDIHFNIILPSIPVPSKWSRSVRFPYENPACSSLFPYTLNAPPISFFVIWKFGGRQDMKLTTVQFSPVPCYPVPLRTIKSSPLSYYQTPWPIFYPQYKRPVYS
jgi:hypothetical protein